MSAPMKEPVDWYADTYNCATSSESLPTGTFVARYAENKRVEDWCVSVQAPGVVAFISAKDVPGENKVKGGASDAPLFAGTPNYTALHLLCFFSIPLISFELLSLYGEFRDF